MKAYIYLLTTVIFISSLVADEKVSYDGYAFMVLGSESVNYQEKASLGPIESSVSANNIVLVSGGLTRVNDDFDFSIVTTSTLFANSATEQWRLSGDYGSLTKNTLLQENSFDIIGSKFKMLIHYKQTQNFRFVFGPAYTLDTFKRYNWESKNPVVSDEVSIQEERYASLHAHLGIAYESYAAAIEGFRYSLELTYGQPLWQEVKNTKEEYNNLEYSSHKGHNIDASMNATYTLDKGIEVGLYLAYSQQYREAGEIQRVNINDELFDVEWPENYLTHYRSGLIFVWKFRE